MATTTTATTTALLAILILTLTHTTNIITLNLTSTPTLTRQCLTLADLHLTLVPTLSRNPHLEQLQEPTIPRTHQDHTNNNINIHQLAQYDQRMPNLATTTPTHILTLLTQIHEPTQERILTNLLIHNNYRNNHIMIKALTDPLRAPLKPLIESNRANPSDGGAKSDSAEHEVHKCMDCGKVYKHPNCLWKHRWEHSTYWKSATKFLLSKHQQVRMMEAAAILLGMDEARAADKDAIVSTVIKQRGMGGPSSTSSSPPTSTKSLSTSPPPSSEAIRRTTNTKSEQTKEEPSSSLGLHTSRPRPSVSETQNDIMMLTALRKASSAPSKASGPDQPQAVPSISPKDPSSSSSTPPTLADDESVPELDEEMVVSPPQPSGPNPSDKGMGLGMGMSVGMSMAMEVDPKHYSRQDPHQPFHAQQTYRFPSGYQHPPHPSYPTQQ
ncbi:hypothetical protein BGZ82_011432 [Podila clonocystis]|nr:hypothetical protein BGZ82_011432 [Podila clonocystis]